MRWVDLKACQSILLVIVMIHVFGCSQQNIPLASERPIPALDPELSAILAQYQAEAKAAEAPVAEQKSQELVRLVFVDDLGRSEDGSLKLGRCERYEETQAEGQLELRSVSILRPQNGSLGPYRFQPSLLKAIVYHELGHCLHDFKGHLESQSGQLMSARLPPIEDRQLPQLIDQHFHLMRAHQTEL